MSQSEIAWVAQLSCGHVVGSVPPPMREIETPPSQPTGMFTGYASPVPTVPVVVPFTPAPDKEQVFFCTQEPCNGEGRWVVDIVFNKNEEPVNLAEKRAR